MNHALVCLFVFFFQKQFLLVLASPFCKCLNDTDYKLFASWLPKEHVTLSSNSGGCVNKNVLIIFWNLQRGHKWKEATYPSSRSACSSEIFDATTEAGDLQVFRRMG